MHAANLKLAAIVQLALLHQITHCSVNCMRVPGLKNSGNTCFFNGALQVRATCLHHV